MAATLRLQLACLVIVLVIGALVSGCAGSLIALDRSTVGDMAQQPTAVVVLVPDKRVTYFEYLYRVLWSETKTDSYSVEGIWDPGEVLEEHFKAAAQTALKVPVVTLRAVASPSYATIVKALEGSLNRPSDAKQVVARLGTGCEDLATAGTTHVEVLRRFPNLKYVFEVVLTQMVIENPMILPRFVVTTCGRLVRTGDGAVVWTGVGYGLSKLEGRTPFAEFERNGLALLKEHYGRAVVDLVAAEGPFLKDLIPRSRRP